MNNKEIKISCLKLVVDGGNEMVSRGLTVGTWGNISIRDPETNLFYIKPSECLTTRSLLKMWWL